MQTVTLTAPATGVPILPEVWAGILVGGDPAGLSFVPTCGTQPAERHAGHSRWNRLIRAFPDGRSVFAVTPPTVEIGRHYLQVSPPVAIAVGQSGCPAPRGWLPISFVTQRSDEASGYGSSRSGTGRFHPDATDHFRRRSVAYILTSNSPNVLVYRHQQPHYHIDPVGKQRHRAARRV